jgi:hypothetical protein
MYMQVRGSFPASSKTMIDSGNLTIMNLAKEDQGPYECIATNVVASAVATTLLIIERMYGQQRRLVRFYSSCLFLIFFVLKRRQRDHIGLSSTLVCFQLPQQYKTPLLLFSRLR